MADRYDLRSQQDIDGSTYAALPGTTPGEFVPRNNTPMKMNLAPGREMPGMAHLPKGVLNPLTFHRSRMPPFTMDIRACP